MTTWTSLGNGKGALHNTCGGLGFRAAVSRDGSHSLHGNRRKLPSFERDNNVPRIPVTQGSVELGEIVQATFLWRKRDDFIPRRRKYDIFHLRLRFPGFFNCFELYLQLGDLARARACVERAYALVCTAQGESSADAVAMRKYKDAPELYLRDFKAADQHFIATMTHC